MTNYGRVKKDSLAISNKHYRYYTFGHFLKTQKRLGIGNIELWGGTPHIWIDAYRADDGKEMKKLVSQYGLKISAFVPEFSSFRYSLGISDSSVYSKAMEYLKRCAHYTAQLETGYMLMELNGYSMDGDFAVQWDSLLKTMRSLGGIAAQEGIRAAIFTNMSDGTNLINSNERLRSCLNTVNNSCIVPALDLSAMYMAAESVEVWMDTWKERLAYVHIVDYDGNTFSGDGKVDDNSLLETLGRLEACGYCGMIGAVGESRSCFTEPEQWDKKITEYFKTFFEDGD